MFKRLAIFALFFGALTAPAQTIYVDSYRYAGGTTYLLDEYPGAAAAYSLRVLAAAFENSDLVEVRRSSDDATSGFTAAEITDGTLATWVGAGNDGFVVTWYDQSGNSRDATQATESDQPQIVTSGVVETDPDTGLPAIYNNQKLGWVTGYDLGSTWSIFVAASQKSGASSRLLSGTENRVLTFNRNSFSFYDGSAQIIGSTTATPGTSAAIGTFLKTTSWAAGYINGSDETDSSSSNTNTWNGLTIGVQSGVIGSADKPQAYYHEVIVYPSDQSSNRTGIESNINAHYSIY
jgi:hypothetical protein